jgi:hypothetical protein
VRCALIGEAIGISGWRIHRVHAAYTSAVQMLWIYTSLALITGITLSPFVAGLLALSMNSAAFLAEIFRSGLQSVARGQHEATSALGFTPWQSMRRVIGPQALRTIIPPGKRMGQCVQGYLSPSNPRRAGASHSSAGDQFVDIPSVGSFHDCRPDLPGACLPAALLVEFLYARRRAEARA